MHTGSGSVDLRMAELGRQKGLGEDGLLSLGTYCVCH